MSIISLKRLFSKKDFLTLMWKMEESLGQPFAVLHKNGEVLFGSTSELAPGMTDGRNTSPVELDGKLLGHVRGLGSAVPLVASILTQWAKAERDKKSLVRDALQKYKEINLLYDLSEKIATSLDPDQVAELIIQEAKNNIRADTVSLLLINDRSGLLEVLASYGNTNSQDEMIQDLLGITGSILASGKAEIVNDTELDSRFFGTSQSVLSLICVPLKVKGSVIGVIKLGTHESYVYKAEDLMLLSALASQAAAAIENARLYRSLEHKVKRRTQDLSNALRRLNDELADAANYVMTLLPKPKNEYPVRADWRYIPSTSLGGDSFGYHWLDEDHFAMYLLDVSGHGVGAALLSVTALNALRSKVLPKTDFTQPDQVLSALNNRFQMERHNDMYFTCWYGVYNQKTKRLQYSSAGHPPALLLQHTSNGEHVSPVCMNTRNMFIGWEENTIYRKKEILLDNSSTIYVYSDGVYEVELKDGSTWEFESFLEFMGQPVRENSAHDSKMDMLLERARELNGDNSLADDFTILEVSISF